VYALIVHEHHGVLSRGVVGYLSVEDVGPEAGHRAGVGAIDGDTEEGTTHDGQS
jgi:hypothetical protein